jgi:integrase
MLSLFAPQLTMFMGYALVPLLLYKTPSAIVQQALGHSSLNTTSRYLAHVAPIDVVDAMREQ